MKKVLLTLALVFLLVGTVQAVEYTAPTVPEQAQSLMPPTESFGEGAKYLLKEGIRLLEPSFKEAAGACLGVIAISLLASLLRSLPGTSTSAAVELACGVAIGGLLLSSAHSLIQLGAQTVNSLSEYGKLLLPVLTGALAAQGGITSATALYAGTMVFNSVLCTIIARLLIPMLYGSLALAIANCATAEPVLKQLQSFINWLMTWALKLIIYAFTGYMGITNVISGGADAAAIKATKLTISGMVPVVGGMLSDASEAVLVSAGLVKRAVGIYGLLAVLAIWLTPFLRIGTQYLLLKASSAISGVFGSKRITGLVQDFSKAMGLLLSMTGTICLLLLISTVCFLKGMG